MFYDKMFYNILTQHISIISNNMLIKSTRFTTKSIILIIKHNVCKIHTL